jgi:hypothetical protein
LVRSRLPSAPLELFNETVPLRRFQFGVDLARNELPRFVPALLGFVAPRSLLCEQRGSLLGRFPPPWLDRFQPALRLHCSPFPDLFGSGVILPRAFRPLQRSPPTACLPCLPSFPRLPIFQPATSTRFARKRLPWGFRPLRDFNRGSSNVGSRSPVRILPRVAPVGTRPCGRSVLDVSHVLDGFFRSRPCGLVSSRCRVQDFVLQGFSPHSKPCQFSLAVALVSFLRRACGLTRASPVAVDFRALLPE